MILLVYSVYDSKVQAYATPFLQRSKGEALRGFQEAANNSEINISRHPADYSLMELGTYDDQVGQFKNHTAPLNLGLASQYKNPPASPAPLFDRPNLAPMEGVQ